MNCCAIKHRNLYSRRYERKGRRKKLGAGEVLITGDVLAGGSEGGC